MHGVGHVIVTHESGSAREYMVPFWEARQPRSFLGWGKSTQLGYSLGLAMGAKLAALDKQVINVVGDMAFSTVGLDIETAVRCHIPILTLILNNASMAIYDNSRFPVALEPTPWKPMRALCRKAYGEIDIWPLPSSCSS